MDPKGCISILCLVKTWQNLGVSNAIEQFSEGYISRCFECFVALKPH